MRKGIASTRKGNAQNTKREESIRVYSFKVCQRNISSCRANRAREQFAFGENPFAWQLNHKSKQPHKADLHGSKIDFFVLQD
jgi:hypothetical protein